jgi:hypothetical protein
LWADIDITRHSRRIGEWVQLCLSRAGASDIPLSMRATLNSVRAFQALQDVSTRVEELDLQINAGIDYTGYSFELARKMLLRPSHLRFLRLRGHVFTEDRNNMPVLEIQRLLSRFLAADEGRPPTLAMLVIHGGKVPDSLPSLPDLVHLDLQRVTLSAQFLCHMLQGSPKLESLSLMPNMKEPWPTADVAYLQSPATKPFKLLHLRTLRISAPAEYAEALLKVLPDPSSQLEMTLVTGTDPRTNGSLAHLDPIIARLHRYWTTVSGETPLPDGCLDVYWSLGKRTGVLMFGHLHDTNSSTSPQRLSKSLNNVGDRNRPSLYFSTEYNLWDQHALLDEVQTVLILIPSRHIEEPETGRQRLRLQESLKMYCVVDLPRLNTLVIRKAGFSDELSEYRQVTQFLLDRQTSGFPAIALQLQRCAGPWQQAVVQLETSGLVSSVTCT